MSRRYLYAVVKHPPLAPLGPGLAGEPLSLVALAGVVAVVGEMADAPAATPDTLRGHDEVVRRLAGISDAVLPARSARTDRGRFGEVGVRDEAPAAVPA